MGLYHGKRRRNEGEYAGGSTPAESSLIAITLGVFRVPVSLLFGFDKRREDFGLPSLFEGKDELRGARVKPRMRFSVSLRRGVHGESQEQVFIPKED